MLELVASKSNSTFDFSSGMRRVTNTIRRSLLLHCTRKKGRDCTRPDPMYLVTFNRYVWPPTGISHPQKLSYFHRVQATFNRYKLSSTGTDHFQEVRVTFSSYRSLSTDMAHRQQVRVTFNRYRPLSSMVTFRDTGRVQQVWVTFNRNGSPSTGIGHIQ